MYSSLFSIVDPNGNNKINSKDFMIFIQKSKLPKEQIKKIWELVVTPGAAYIHRDDVYVALKLISFAQNGIDVSENAIKEGKESPFPNINLSSPEPPQRPKTQEQELISNEEKEKYFKWFESMDINKVGYLDSQQMQGVLEKVPLSQDILGSVWDMSDIGGNGQFDKPKFALAMFLLSKAKKNQPLPALPPNVLQYFKETKDGNTEVERKAISQSVMLSASPPMPTAFIASPSPRVEIKPQIQSTYTPESMTQSSNESVASMMSAQTNMKSGFNTQIKAAQKSNEILSVTEKKLKDHLAWLQQIYESDMKNLKELTSQNLRLELCINTLSNDIQAMEKKVDEQKLLLETQQRKSNQLQNALIQKQDEYKKIPVVKVNMPMPNVPSNENKSPSTEPTAIRKSNPFHHAPVKSADDPMPMKKEAEHKKDMLDIKAFDMLDSSELSMAAPPQNKDTIKEVKKSMEMPKEQKKNDFMEFNLNSKNDAWLNFDNKGNTPFDSGNNHGFEFNE